MTRYSSIIVALFLLSSTNNNNSIREGRISSSTVVVVSAANTAATNEADGITFFDEDYDGGDITYFTYGRPRKPGDDNNNNNNNEVTNIPNEAVETFVTTYYNYGSRVDVDELAESISSITEEEESTTSAVIVAGKAGKEENESTAVVEVVDGEGGEPTDTTTTEEEGSPVVVVGSTAELDVVGTTTVNTTFESTNTPTISPTPYTSHPLHDTPIPNNCLRRIEDNRPLSKACLLWMEKNPQWVHPSMSPTKLPSVGPSVFAEVISKIVTVVSDSENENGTIVMNDGVIDEVEQESGSGEGSNSSNGTTHAIYDFEGTLVESMLDVDNSNGTSSTTADSSSSSTTTSTNSTTDSNSTTNDTTTTTTTTEGSTSVSVTYHLSPTDDTFMEVFRPDSPLGTKDKLKIDATSKEEDDGKKKEGGVPTKFIQLKFGLGKIFKDVESMMMEMQTTSMELTSATLTLHAITSTTFGGYVMPISSKDWNEETAVWEDYVRDDKDALNLLPSIDGGNPSVAQFGTVTEGTNVTTDVTIQVLKTLCCIEGKTMALRIVTNSSDGVIYASKEHASGYGPVLTMEFALKTNVTELVPALELSEEDLVLDVIVPTTSPPSSGVPTESPMGFQPAVVRPFKDEGVGEKTPINATDEWIIDDGAEEEDNSNTTSVVSSSFRMTITAIETADERRRLLRTSSSGTSGHNDNNNNKKSNTRHLVADAYQSLQEKEEPAIIEHLTHVYAEVLSIAPTNISVVFEEDLVVEDITSVVIRESVFRVMAIFDDPDVSNIQPEDAANVLDQATIYSFIGPEELAFISVYKNTSEPIVDEPATYDVTVMKQDNTMADDLQGASANEGDANEGEENGSSSSTSTTPQWLPPTLIAGASVVVVASSAAALLLYRHRRGDSDHGGPRKRGGDSPRSLAETDTPSTPSPNVFMDRFKNKKKFDYAEFEDDQSSPEVMSPLTASDLNEHAREFSATGGRTAIGVSRSRMPQQQQVVDGSRINDIKFTESQNISFDESSVSDVSAHVLGAKGSLKSNDASQAESLLLDTTMESYNMEAMSALDVGRFENVLPSSPTRQSTQQRERGLSQATSEDDAGSVPSELYSNLSIDSSLLHSHDTSGATYGNHLFTLDMLRNKDSSLLQMPPPPSDVASDSNSVGIDDVDNIGEPIVPTDSGVSGIENVPMREKNEQDAVSQSINNELSKVMELLKSTDDGSHIGTVNGAPGSSTTKNAASRPYEGLNVLVDDASTDAEPDENDPMKQMNNALTDCMNILEKARVHHHQQPQAPSSNTDSKRKGGVAAAYLEALSRKNSVDDGEEESSLVTQRLD